MPEMPGTPASPFEHSKSMVKVYDHSKALIPQKEKYAHGVAHATDAQWQALKNILGWHDPFLNEMKEGAQNKRISERVEANPNLKYAVRAYFRHKYPNAKLNNPQALIEMTEAEGRLHHIQDPSIGKKHMIHMLPGKTEQKEWKENAKPGPSSIAHRKRSVLEPRLLQRRTAMAQPPLSVFEPSKEAVELYDAASRICPKHEENVRKQMMNEGEQHGHATSPLDRPPPWWREYARNTKIVDRVAKNPRLKYAVRGRLRERYPNPFTDGDHNRQMVYIEGRLHRTPDPHTEQRPPIKMPDRSNYAQWKKEGQPNADESLKTGHAHTLG